MRCRALLYISSNIIFYNPFKYYLIFTQVTYTNIMHQIDIHGFLFISLTICKLELILVEAEFQTEIYIYVSQNISILNKIFLTLV